MLGISYTSIGTQNIICPFFWAFKVLINFAITRKPSIGVRYIFITPTTSLGGQPLSLFYTVIILAGALVSEAGQAETSGSDSDSDSEMECQREGMRRDGILFTYLTHVSLCSETEACALPVS